MVASQTRDFFFGPPGFAGPVKSTIYEYPFAWYVKVPRIKYFVDTKTTTFSQFKNLELNALRGLPLDQVNHCILKKGPKGAAI